MNISKFLLIDAALTMAAIPLLFLVQGGKISPLLRRSNKDELLGKTSIKIQPWRTTINYYPNSTTMRFTKGADTKKFAETTSHK